MNKYFSSKKAKAEKKKPKPNHPKRTTIFAPMSVAHVDDEDDNNHNTPVEKHFPNGDYYMGQWAHSRPHGHGKCLWAEDGCMYVGDWVNGKAAGKGKFSWPSGATYEGQFKNGYMEGDGTYTGSQNDTYRGTWLKNMRHGRGVRTYDNGDYYDGGWKRARPHGRGRYQWANGNHYAGHWRNGTMSGTGTMTWAKGNQYEGSWADGFPKGNGTLRWADGSCYVGFWSENPSEQSGTYFPSSSSSNVGGSFDWDPQEVYLVKLSDCRISPGEKIPVFPSEKAVNWTCEEKIYPGFKRENGARLRRATLRRLSNGGHSTGSESDLSTEGGGISSSNECFSSEREVDNGVEEELDVLQAYRRPRLKIKPAKRQGLTISRGHKNYELMLNLQLGIRHSVGRPAPATSLDLKAAAFDPRDKVWTKFPPLGSKHTPPHQSCEFKWKDYCPLVFR